MGVLHTQAFSGRVPEVSVSVAVVLLLSLGLLSLASVTWVGVCYKRRCLASSSEGQSSYDHSELCCLIDFCCLACVCKLTNCLDFLVVHLACEVCADDLFQLVWLSRSICRSMRNLIKLLNNSTTPNYLLTLKPFRRLEFSLSPVVFLRQCEVPQILLLWKPWYM